MQSLAIFAQLLLIEHLYWSDSEHDIQKQVYTDTRINNEGGKNTGRKTPVMRVKMEANTVQKPFFD